jgi:DNA repair protein RecN (Recombination protein N)
MSLQRISLRDFVIVRQLELEFGAGFTVLSGETGAGKSILIDALQLVLGARADSNVVREGAARSELCAEFSTPAHLHPWLQDNGFDAADDLLLKRSIDAQGKSRAWINGSAATATQLREIGDSLVDIHGQHAWQSLTRPAAVRGLLDAYAGLDPQTLNLLWSTWRQAQQTLANARLAQDHLQQERERLSWQISEVDKLSPQANEWEELNAQHSRLSNAQSLMDAAKARGDTQVMLHAQCSAEGFYKRLGFTAHGDIFQDAGIDHIEMSMHLP